MAESLVHAIDLQCKTRPELLKSLLERLLGLRNGVLSTQLIDPLIIQVLEQLQLSCADGARRIQYAVLNDAIAVVDAGILPFKKLKAIFDATLGSHPQKKTWTLAEARRRNSEWTAADHELTLNLEDTLSDDAQQSLEPERTLPWEEGVVGLGKLQAEEPDLVKKPVFATDQTQAQGRSGSSSLQRAVKPQSEDGFMKPRMTSKPGKSVALEEAPEKAAQVGIESGSDEDEPGPQKNAQPTESSRERRRQLRGHRPVVSMPTPGNKSKAGGLERQGEDGLLPDPDGKPVVGKVVALQQSEHGGQVADIEVGGVTIVGIQASGELNASDANIARMVPENKSTADIKRELDRLDRLSRSGNLQAQVHIGFRYILGKGAPLNQRRGFEWLLQAAKQGQRHAQAFVGQAYFTGGIVPENLPEAAHWLELSAKAGDATGQYRWGHCHYFGKGVKRDLEKAVYWLTQSAQQGHGDAQNDLGSCYFSGDVPGGKPDVVEALKWRTKAAQSGVIEAQTWVGIFYCHVINPPQVEVGLPWLQKAVVLNDAGAQHALGLLYLEGKGVEKNAALGLELINKAAAQGEEHAVKFLKARANRVSDSSQAAEHLAEQPDQQ